MLHLKSTTKKLLLTFSIIVATLFGVYGGPRYQNVEIPSRKWDLQKQFKFTQKYHSKIGARAQYPEFFRSAKFARILNRDHSLLLAKQEILKEFPEATVVRKMAMPLKGLEKVRRIIVKLPNNAVKRRVDQYFVIGDHSADGTSKPGVWAVGTMEVVETSENHREVYFGRNLRIDRYGDSSRQYFLTTIGCVDCHFSGPLGLYGEIEKNDQKNANQFNHSIREFNGSFEFPYYASSFDQIPSYGAAKDFEQKKSRCLQSLNLDRYTEEKLNRALNCQNCHNGQNKKRPNLKIVSNDSKDLFQYMIHSGEMPKSEILTQIQRKALLKCFYAAL